MIGKKGAVVVEWLSLVLQNKGSKGSYSKHFYTPGLKGPPGASSNQIVRPSVHNSVPLTNKVQYLKFG